MTTAIDIFKSAVPTYAQNAKSKAMQSMAGGMAGGGFGNRISLRGNKFRFIQGGEDIGAHPQPYLDVVIFALSEHVQRLYYKGAFEAGSKEPPSCYSLNGKTPEADSPERQAATCAVCPQNVKGSGRQGNTKACAYKKRVVALSPDDLEGALWAHDVNAMSMFGEQAVNQNLYSFKGYFEKLSAHNLDIAALVTRLTFDDSSSVPKLHFTATRVLTQDEFAIVQQRMGDEEVAKMLQDVVNELEVEDAAAVAPAVVKAQPVVAAPAPQPAPAPAPAAHGVGGLVVDEPASPKRGFGKAKTTAAPTPGNGAAPVAAAGKPKLVMPDLDKLVNFDDDN